jgi:hypothetical protein
MGARFSHRRYKSSVSQSQFRDYLGFNDDDLIANRKGYLSKRQREKMLLHIITYDMILFQVLALLPVLYFVARYESGNRSNSDLLFLAIFSLMYLFFVCSNMYDIINRRKDIKATSITGYITFEKNTVRYEGRIYLYFYMIINDLRFEVPERLYTNNVLQDGILYIVYHSTRTHTFLSMEPAPLEATF